MVNGGVSSFIAWSDHSPQQTEVWGNSQQIVMIRKIKKWFPVPDSGLSRDAKNFSVYIYNRRDGVVVRVSASQSVDLGFILHVKSH